MQQNTNPYHGPQFTPEELIVLELFDDWLNLSDMHEAYKEAYEEPTTYFQLFDIFCSLADRGLFWSRAVPDPDYPPDFKSKWKAKDFTL